MRALLPVVLVALALVAAHAVRGAQLPCFQAGDESSLLLLQVGEVHHMCFRGTSPRKLYELRVSHSASEPVTFLAERVDHEQGPGRTMLNTFQSRFAGAAHGDLFIDLQVQPEGVPYRESDKLTAVHVRVILDPLALGVLPMRALKPLLVAVSLAVFVVGGALAYYCARLSKGLGTKTRVH